MRRCRRSISSVCRIMFDLALLSGEADLEAAYKEDICA